MNSIQGALFKPSDDFDPYVRFVRFRYLLVYVSHKPEVFNDLLPLVNVWLSATEGDSLYSYKMLEGVLHDLTTDREIESKHAQTRYKDIERFLRAADAWYQEHDLHLIGIWCKDIAMAFLADKRAKRFLDSPGASYYKLFVSQEDRATEHINFIDYLYQAAQFRDDVFGVYFPSFWSYDFAFKRRSAFREAVMEQIGKHLDEFINESEELALTRYELQRVQNPRANSSFTLDDRLRWLYSRHIEKLTIEQLAEKYEVKVAEQFISRSTLELARLIGIAL